MKIIFLILAAFSLCSCKKDGAVPDGASRVASSGMVRNIKLEGLKENEVILELERWLITAGYTKPHESWETFAGKPVVLTGEGERDTSYAYVKNLSDDKGSIALRVALASELEPYVTVLHVSKYEGDTARELKLVEAQYSKAFTEFTAFVDSTYAGAEAPRRRLGGRP